MYVHIKFIWHLRCKGSGGVAVCAAVQCRSAVQAVHGVKCVGGGRGRGTVKVCSRVGKVYVAGAEGSA